MSSSPQVNLFLRKPNRIGNFSIEIFYEELHKALASKINIKIIKLPYKNKGIIPRIFNIIFCFFNQADINHIVGDITYCSILMNKKKLITTILDCISLKSSKSIKYYIFKLFLYDIPVRRSSKVIFISEASKLDLEYYLKKNVDNSKVIPVTVSKSFFNLPTNKNKSFKNNFLIIGTAPNKNIERVAKSLKNIKCNLNIIGQLSSSQKNQLLKSKINFKEFNYPLTESEMINQYKKADILIFASTLEGFGMPILEANLTQTCVLTSKISSMPYVAANSAVYVDPYSVRSIKNGLIKIIKNKDLRNQMISNGIINSKRFKIEEIANQHYQLYQSL